MAKQLEINQYDAHILKLAIKGMLEFMEDIPDDEPHKKRLAGIHSKIHDLYPGA